MNSPESKTIVGLLYVMVVITAGIFLVTFYFFPQYNRLSGKWLFLKGEKVPAVKVVSTNNFFEKMKTELETTKNGDILETRWIGEWEGSRTLLVVTQDSKDGRVYYQVKGRSVILQSSSELAERIVKVYHVDTPEWREQTEVFMKQ